MGPLVFEFLGSLLVGGMVYLTVFHKPSWSVTQTKQVLAVHKIRSLSLRHKSHLSTRDKNRVEKPESKERAKTKVGEETSEQTHPADQAVFATTTILGICPSCGLQAPEKLLAEHLIGTPAHRKAPPTVFATEAEKIEVYGYGEEDDSYRSIRGLLQILVPPRAFGLRHGHRLARTIPSIVQDIVPRQRYSP